MFVNSPCIYCDQISIILQMIHCLTARALIKDYGNGMLDVDPSVRDEMKRKRRPAIISTSCQHNVVSPFTSFVAVEERQKVQHL